MALKTWTLLIFILGYVDQAKEEGAEIFQIEVPEALKANKGLYYPPTLITHVNAASTVVMEEIFGPVAVALPFRYVLTYIANTQCQIWLLLFPHFHQNMM